MYALSGGLNLRDFSSPLPRVRSLRPHSAANNEILQAVGIQINSEQALPYPRLANCTHVYHGHVTNIHRGYRTG